MNIWSRAETELIKIFGDDKLPEFSDSDTWMRGYQTTVMISKITNTTTAYIQTLQNISTATALYCSEQENLTMYKEVLLFFFRDRDIHNLWRFLKSFNNHNKINHWAVGPGHYSYLLYYFYYKGLIFNENLKEIW